MRTVELFCGTKSFSKVAKTKGMSTFTIDNDPQHNPDLCVSILDIEEIPKMVMDNLVSAAPEETQKLIQFAFEKGRFGEGTFKSKKPAFL